MSTKILPKEEKEARSSLSFRDYQKQGYFQLIKVIKAISLQALKKRESIASSFILFSFYD